MKWRNKRTGERVWADYRPAGSDWSLDSDQDNNGIDDGIDTAINVIATGIEIASLFSSDTSSSTPDFTGGGGDFGGGGASGDW